MKIGKKVEPDLTERFEAALDYIDALDKVPFYLKREAAEVAAKAALEYLRKGSGT